MNYRATQFPITREAMPFAAPLIFAALLAAILGWYGWALLLIVLFIYVLAFFRNPERDTPRRPGVIVAPADGKVVAAGTIASPDMPGGQGLRVAIFMNVFNCHMNWAPYSGTVEQSQHYCGSFINAMEDKACDENERHIIRLRTPENVTMIVKLVAGLVARRIVCPLETGDRIETGEKTGLIRFGSRVEVILPADAALHVHVGMTTRGGETVIGVLNSAQHLRDREHSHASSEMAEAAGA